MKYIKRQVKRLLKKIAIRYDIYERLRRISIENKNNLLKSSIRTKGPNLKLNGNVTVIRPEGLELGENVHIGDGTYIMARGGVSIGDNTHISRNVTIYSANHNYLANRVPYDESLIMKPVTIGSNVWIGRNVSIIPGVTVNEGAIIGMGTVVTNDIPKGFVVGSQDTKVIKHRDEHHYNDLVENKSYGGVSGMKYHKSELFENAVEKGSDMTFFVGTGRCGSTSLSKYLNQHPSICASHERIFPLIYLSTAYEHGQVSRNTIKSVLEGYYLHSSNLPAGKYCEINQKNSNLIETLSEILPEAKFVWLVRDGKDFVNSAVNKGWYSEWESRDHTRVEWVSQRIDGSRIGAYSPEEWDRMSSFEKNCWYWAYWNKRIQRQLAKLERSRWTRIKIEEIEDSIKDIIEFLDASDDTIDTSRRYNSLESKSSWDSNQDNIFQKQCGSLMKDLEYL